MSNLQLQKRIAKDLLLAAAPQIFAKVDLLPIDNDSEKEKVAQKNKPFEIPRKLLVTLLLSINFD